MKTNFKKYLSLMMAVLMLFSSALTVGAAYADGALPDGTYSVTTHLKQEYNLNNLSMADGAIEHTGKLEVTDEGWHVIVTFKTLVQGTIKGNASDIQYYENGVGSALHPAQVITTRTVEPADPNAPTVVPGMVKVPLVPDSSGRFLNFYVDAMGFNPNAFLEISNITPIYTITVDSDIENGTITPAGETEVVEGNSQSYSIVPSNGYRVADVLVDGESVGAVTSYDFNSVAADHTIGAVFEQIPTHTITATADANGSIEPNGATDVTEGTNQAYTITSADGYHIKDVLVDGQSKGAINSYTFENVTAAHTISATFEKDVVNYNITIIYGDFGIVEPGSDVTVEAGKDARFTFIPNPDCHIKDVLVDGVSEGVIEEYTFTNVQANHTLEAIFEQDVFYTITASAGENGTISPIGETEVKQGASQAYAITAEDGYHVADVLVDGISVGPQANYLFEDVEADHSIEARFDQNDTTRHYTLTASAGEHGAIAPQGDTDVVEGESQRYTITAEAGYRIKDVTVDSQSVKDLLVAGQSQNEMRYTFNAVSSNHTIVASFEVIPATYTLTASAGQNGAIDPVGEIVVTEGEDQTYTITPDGGYHIKDVLVDGQSKGAINSYTFENVTANHAINAEFEADVVAKETYTLTASAGQNGAISPSGIVEVEEGADQTYMITPDSGYHIKDVLVDDVSQGAIDSYTFEAIAANHTISVQFEQDSVTPTPTPATYTVTASAAANGSIDPADTSTVNEGDSLTYTITPDDGYHVKDVTVDGESVGALSSYTFENVTGNHEISAEFEANAAAETTYTLTASAAEHGAIEPSGTTIATPGAVQVFAITADAGYKVSNVTVDGVSVGAVTSYKFENIAANHVIAAQFAVDEATEDPENPGEVPEDETFMVYTTIKKAYDITEDSMAAPSIKNVGKVEVIDGKWYLTVTYQSIHFMGLLGNAEDIMYYQSGLGSELYPAQVLSYRTDENGDSQVEDVRMPVEADGYGVYINMYISAMGRRADAYLVYDRDMYNNMPEEEEDRSEDVAEEVDSNAAPQAAAAATESEETSKSEALNLRPSEWRYDDVSPQRDYYQAVENLSQKGLLKGTGKRMFRPYQTVNRAMLATLLYRVAGKPTVDVVQSFDDVSLNQWYSAAVAWAKKMNIVNGFSDDVFAPDGILTKEQIIAILYRYQTLIGADVAGAADLMGFSDYQNISPYARRAMAWAVANDMITLDDYGRLNPQEAVTRAAMAVLIDKIVD